MDKYQFTMLAWIKLSDSEAKTSSGWYQGPGWYFNPLEGSGKKLAVRLAAKCELEVEGQLEALNLVGVDGWFVAAYMPQQAYGFADTVGFAITGNSPSGPCFILQRRWAA